jgi:hypothetical protein
MLPIRIASHHQCCLAHHLRKGGGHCYPAILNSKKLGIFLSSDDTIHGAIHLLDMDNISSNGE